MTSSRLDTLSRDRRDLPPKIREFRQHHTAGTDAATGTTHDDTLSGGNKVAAMAAGSIPLRLTISNCSF
jgi:hypothetical protein